VTEKRGLTIALATVGAILVGLAGFLIGRSTDGHMAGTPMAQNGHGMGTMMGTGGAPWNGPMMNMGSMPGMSMDADGAMAMSDQAFLAMMIPHHQMAVDMARIEVDRGSDPETVTLARTVISDQQKEIAQMRNWYQERYGSAPPSMPMSGAMAMMGMGMDMDELRTTKEPDRAFLRMMVPHHAGALLMSDMVLAGSPSNEVRGLARRIVAAQSREIGTMQEMRERIAPPLG